MKDLKEQPNRLDTRVALVEQSINNIHNTLERIEKRFDRIDARFDKIEDRIIKLHDKLDFKINDVRSEKKTEFKCLVSIIITLNAGLFGLIAHGFNWF